MPAIEPKPAYGEGTLPSQKTILGLISFVSQDNSTTIRDMIVGLNLFIKKTDVKGIFTQFRCPIVVRNSKEIKLLF
jgi:hypothetical protein